MAVPLVVFADGVLDGPLDGRRFAAAAAGSSAAAAHHDCRIFLLPAAAGLDLTNLQNFRSYPSVARPAHCSAEDLKQTRSPHFTTMAIPATILVLTVCLPRVEGRQEQMMCESE